MNKTGLLLTSLVGAVPGAILAILVVLAFVNYAGGWSASIKGLAGLMLILGVFLAVMPAGILVFGGEKRAKPPKKAQAALDPADTEAAKALESAESVPAFEDDSSFDLGQQADSDAFAESMGATSAEAGSDDFATGDEFELDSDDDAKAKKR